MILRIALPTPLHRLFDYRLPVAMPLPAPGCRVRVPFGNRELIGLVVEHSEHSDMPLAKLKPVLEILDQTPVLEPLLFKLGCWAAGYYQHPIGDALSQLLPVLLRQGKPAELAHATLWRACSNATLERLSSSAHRQRELLQLLLEHPQGISTDAIRAEGAQPRLLSALEQKGLAESFAHQPLAHKADSSDQVLQEAPLPLHDEQAAAMAALTQTEGFRAFLLYGVTGSGKTEIYLQAIERTLRAGRQALVLVPEIGLTPQTLARFRARFRVPIHVLHSNLSDRQRLDTWLHARAGPCPHHHRHALGHLHPVAKPGPDHRR